MLLVSSILHTPTRGRVSLIANKKNEKEFKDNLDRSRLDCFKPCFDQNALTVLCSLTLLLFLTLADVFCGRARSPSHQRRSLQAWGLNQTQRARTLVHSFIPQLTHTYTHACAGSQWKTSFSIVLCFLVRLGRLFSFLRFTLSFNDIFLTASLVVCVYSFFPFLFLSLFSRSLTALCSVPFALVTVLRPTKTIVLCRLAWTRDAAKDGGLFLFTAALRIGCILSFRCIGSGSLTTGTDHLSLQLASRRCFRYAPAVERPLWLKPLLAIRKQLFYHLLSPDPVVNKNCALFVSVLYPKMPAKQKNRTQTHGTQTTRALHPCTWSGERELKFDAWPACYNPSAASTAVQCAVSIRVCRSLSRSRNILFTSRWPPGREWQQREREWKRASKGSTKAVTKAIVCDLTAK